jgi:hypothetical protein
VIRVASKSLAAACGASAASLEDPAWMDCMVLPLLLRRRPVLHHVLNLLGHRFPPPSQPFLCVAEALLGVLPGERSNTYFAWLDPGIPACAPVPGSLMPFNLYREADALQMLPGAWSFDLLLGAGRFVIIVVSAHPSRAAEPRLPSARHWVCRVELDAEHVRDGTLFMAPHLHELPYEPAPFAEDGGGFLFGSGGLQQSYFLACGMFERNAAGLAHFDLSLAVAQPPDARGCAPSATSFAAKYCPQVFVVPLVRGKCAMCAPRLVRILRPLQGSPGTVHKLHGCAHEAPLHDHEDSHDDDDDDDLAG